MKTFGEPKQIPRQLCARHKNVEYEIHVSTNWLNIPKEVKNDVHTHLTRWMGKYVLSLQRRGNNPFAQIVVVSDHQSFTNPRDL